MFRLYQWEIHRYHARVSRLSWKDCIEIYLSLAQWALSLTHWGRVTHICVSKVIIIGSYNGLSPGRRQAIIWNNNGVLSIGLLGTNFSEILIEILIFSIKKMRLKVSSAKWRPFCLGLNVLMLLPQPVIVSFHHTGSRVTWCCLQKTEGLQPLNGWHE